MKQIFLIFLFLFSGFFSYSLTSAEAIDSKEIFGNNHSLPSVLGTSVEVRDYTLCRVDFDKGNSGGVIRCVIEKVIEYGKQLAVPIAIFLLTWSGIYLLMGRTNEEEYKKRIREVFAIIAGFAIMILAVTVVDELFFGTEGEIFQTGEIETDIGERILLEINGLASFLLTLVFPVSVLVLVVSAVQLIIGTDDAIATAKKRVLYVVIGLIVIVMTKGVVLSLMGTGSLRVSSFGLISEIVQWTNIILGFSSVLAVLAIVWAGIQMIVHFGNDDMVNKSKEIIKNVVIGLLIGFSAWGIIYYVLTAGNV